MPQRHKPTPRQRLEARAVEMLAVSRLKENDRIQQQSHTEAENNLARRRCRELLEGGWGSVDWLEPGGHWADCWKD